MTLERAVGDQKPLAAALFDRLADASRVGRGITRASYGDGEHAAHRIMADAARDLGLTVTRDAALNTYMTWPGTDPELKPIVIGSHLDSVAGGGNFDGAAGVVAGLVALAALHRTGTPPAAPVTVMGIRAEESAWFATSYIGSRAALGTLPGDTLDKARRADTGRTLAEHLAEAGGDVARLRAGTPHLVADQLGAYLELHIEQGPVLHAEGFPVGVVTGIRGNFRRPRITWTGEYSHCGGVTRPHRRDAVMAAAAFVAGLDRLWDESEATGQDMAATVGQFFTDPTEHAMTKIAGEVTMSLDVRSLDQAYLADLEARVHRLGDEIAATRGLKLDWGRITRAEIGRVDPGLRRVLDRGVDALGLKSRPIASGAAHDAAAFAAAGVPMAMIFVRNENGSHNPDEAMDLDDFLQATRLLAWTLTQPISTA